MQARRVLVYDLFTPCNRTCTHTYRRIYTHTYTLSTRKHTGTNAPQIAQTHTHIQTRHKESMYPSRTCMLVSNVNSINTVCARKEQVRSFSILTKLLVAEVGCGAPYLLCNKTLTNYLSNPSGGDLACLHSLSPDRCING
jgi:hypothetical protein